MNLVEGDANLSKISESLVLKRIFNKVYYSDLMTRIRDVLKRDAQIPIISIMLRVPSHWLKRYYIAEIRYFAMVCNMLKCNLFILCVNYCSQ